MEKVPLIGRVNGRDRSSRWFLALLVFIRVYSRFLESLIHHLLRFDFLLYG